MYYASFDSTVTQPTQVTGWFEGQTPAMLAVPTSDILELTEVEWNNRLDTPYITGGVLVPTPPPTLVEVQATQIAALISAYQNALLNPISYTSKGGTTKIYQADPQSVANIVQSLAGCQALQATPPGFYWVAEDNTHVPFTYADLQGLAAAMYAPGAAAFAHLQDKKTAVSAATTVAEVEAIIW